MAFVLASLAFACGPADVNGSAIAHGDGDGEESTTPARTTTGDGTGSTPAPTPSASTTTSATAPTTTSTAAPPPPAQPDADKDGFPDSVDCAPNDPNIAGAKLLDDPLATDGNFFTVATGFPTGDWSYDNAYKQTRLANAPDLTLFDKDAAITDAIISVTAASTEITSSISPTLRQMFLVFQAKNENGNVTGVGCGLEVDASANPTQQTSVVSLNGSASKVASTPLDRVARGAVQANELFQMKGTLKNGTLTCEVTIGGNTTTTATASVGSVAGAVGFFTNQTKALFKSASICKLK